MVKVLVPQISMIINGILDPLYYTGGNKGGEGEEVVG